MHEFTLNIYPILNFFVVVLAIFGGFNLFNNIVHVLARYGKDKLDNVKDLKVIDSLTQKDIKIITVENSKEIHDIKRYLINKVNNDEFINN